MALIEDVIFSDPVLQRIFFDKRRLAPRMKSSAALVINHWYAITEYKILFQKAKRPAAAEYYQRKMRARWFAARKLCDGYFMEMPGLSGVGEQVRVFAFDNAAAAFFIDPRARAAYWFKYAQRAPPKLAYCEARSQRGSRRRRSRRV